MITNINPYFKRFRDYLSAKIKSDTSTMALIEMDVRRSQDYQAMSWPEYRIKYNL